MTGAGLGLEIGDGGLVDSPDFHDGRVLGIHVSGDETVLLFLRDGRGDAYRVALGGVERLLADDFRAGNLILDLSVLAGTQIPRELLADLYDNPAVRALDDIVDRAIRTDLRLLELVPSYGCQLIALCARIDLTRTELSLPETP